MSIYFVQHGISLDKSVDVSRPLSEQGKLNVKKIANHLANLGLDIKQVFHSDKPRSAETAHLFATILTVPKIQKISIMNPNDDVNQLISVLEDDCMYVGHLPHMAKIISSLLCGDDSNKLVEYENAAVACVDRNEDGYHLNWLLKPSML